LIRTVETDTISYNILIWGFCEHGMVELATGVLSEMVKKGIGVDTISCNTLVKGFIRKGLLDDAMYLMEMLVSGGVRRDVI